MRGDIDIRLLDYYYDLTKLSNPIDTSDNGGGKSESSPNQIEEKAHLGQTISIRAAMGVENS